MFLGTVTHLAAAVSAAFTAGMSHAFIASAVICALAIACSAVREVRMGQTSRAVASRGAQAIDAQEAGAEAAPATRS